MTDSVFIRIFIAVLAVFRCNRLMDEHRFQTAREEMGKLVSGTNALMGIYRNLLTCDLMFCELLFENRPERLERMLTKGQKKFMKKLKLSISLFFLILFTLFTKIILMPLSVKQKKSNSAFFRGGSL